MHVNWNIKQKRKRRRTRWRTPTIC